MLTPGNECQINPPRVWRWVGVAGLIPRGGERMISSRRLVLAATPPGNFLRDVEPGLSNPTGEWPCARPTICHHARPALLHLPSRETHPYILPLPNPHKLENPFNPSLRQTRVRRTFLSTEPGIYPQGLRAVVERARLAHASDQMPGQRPAGFVTGGVFGLIPRGGEIRWACSSLAGY